jgi:radical SAM protein (TIGR01212 family)
MELTDFGNGKRYNSYTEYFKRTFGGRVQKLSIDAGFTCPNRDGTRGTGGCTYCNNDAFNPSYCQPHKSIKQQITEGIEFHAWRYRRATQYLAYFQAYSNTYAPLEKLKRIFAEALSVPEVCGLVIGTRPDCIDEEKLDYFSSLAKDHYIIIEYGIESVYDNTLKRINRGHSYAEAEHAIRMTAQKGLKTGAHLVFGLPGETRAQMLESASAISSLPLTTVKFHQLQIIQGTAMANDYLIHPDAYQLFGMEAYIKFIVEYAELLNPAIVIERFSGEAPPRFVVAPDWGRVRGDEIIRMIEKYFETQNTRQGIYFKR